MQQQLNKDKAKENKQLSKDLVALFVVMLSYKNSKEFKKLLQLYKNNRDSMKDTIGKIYLKYIKDNKLVITQKEVTKELKQLDKDIINMGNDLKKQENIILATLLYKTYKDTYNKSINIIEKYKTLDKKNISKLIDKKIMETINVKINGKTNITRNIENKTLFVNKVKDNIKKNLNAGNSIEVINKGIDESFQKGGIDISNRLVDNEVSRVFNSSIMEAYKEIDIKRVVYNSTLDINTCSECAGNSGLVMNIDDAISLPLHIRCNCFYTPEI
ncbi:structural protein [Clostridium estertheticum]|uniref:hypothetical protein n=1 Tax=Clostridium estertheticum TaxID=238834 RepID=UPI00124DB569|nr:hypothetical protein [Clostridium estertheticum]MBZ9616796.1 hypothetical protein [Clostridium estertheticum subsp. laramiense]WAG72503.1 hypothetical protein LL032_15260 [Clostridium estertheticum]